MGTGTETRRQAYVLLADLLSYPRPGMQETLRDRWGDIGDQLRDFPRLSSAVEGFLTFLDDASCGTAEELYTDTFDLKPICYPYVGYHIFGESYRRGGFMAALKEKFREVGVSAGTELPDHLGMILRYLAAAAEDADAEALVEECVLPALGKMAAGFKDETNPYARIINALPVFMRKAEYAGGAVVHG